MPNVNQRPKANILDSISHSSDKT